MPAVRRGFTLIEAIITIGVLAVAFGLTGVAVSELIDVQDSAATIADHESVFQSADSLISKFVSYVSLDTPLLKFERETAETTRIVYVAKEYETPGGSILSSSSYALGYSSVTKKLDVTVSVLSGTPNEYMNKSDWGSSKGISSFAFTLDETIGFLTADVSLGENVSRRFCYVLRT